MLKMLMYSQLLLILLNLKKLSILLITSYKLSFFMNIICVILIYKTHVLTIFYPLKLTTLTFFIFIITFYYCIQ